MSTQRVITEVLEERSHQDILFGPEKDDELGLADWVVIASRHIGLACGDGGESGIDPIRFRKQIIRLAAVSIAAVESLDRRTGKVFEAGVNPIGKGW